MNSVLFKSLKNCKSFKKIRLWRGKYFTDLLSLACSEVAYSLIGDFESDQPKIKCLF